MNALPTDAYLDRTLALSRDPYRFISNRCEECGSDTFETRLFLQKVICIRGEEAAKIFYNTTHFSRIGVAPARITKTLFGRGGVQGMDGDAHRHRKMMFMSLMTQERIDELSRISREIWNRRLHQWSSIDRIVLYRQAQEVLTEAICRWAGIPLVASSDLDRRTNELAALFDYAGSIGPKHWWARVARKRNERSTAANTSFRNRTCSLR